MFSTNHSPNETSRMARVGRFVGGLGGFSRQPNSVLSRDQPPPLGGQRLGAEKEITEKRVGLLPEEGWQRRNFDFLHSVLLPSIFTPRTGLSSLANEALTMAPGITATWIGHATFLLQVGGLNILTDPNWALWHGPVKRVRQPGIQLRDLPPIDLVLVSHAHFDHMHRPSMARIANGQPVVVPRGCGNLVRRGNFGNFGSVVELDWWDRWNFSGVEIQLTPARHWGARFLHDTHRGFGGFLIRSDDSTVYHAGDTSYFDGFPMIGKQSQIDLALLPIGAYDAPSGREVHMNPEEAIQAFTELGAKAMAPMHYGTFPLGGEPLREPIERLRAEAERMGLEQSVHVLKEGHPATFLP